MIIHSFISETRDPFERGRQIGEQWARQVQRAVALYLGFFPRVGIDAGQVRRLGEASLAALEAWCPAPAREIEGLACGARLPLWQLAALNARTEILAVMPRQPVEGECSTAVYLPGGGAAPQSLQTWDWHDSLVPDGLLLQLVTGNGMTVKLFTEFGMLGKIGVNSAGLGMHFNILHHASDHADAGVPVHAVARRVLEEATSVAHAIELVGTARVSASTVLTVFSRDPAGLQAASVEMSPAGVAVVPPRSDGWVLHTNHFIDPGLAIGERTADVSTTYARFNHLADIAPNMAHQPLTERADAFCGEAGEQAVVCFHPDLSQPDTERWETLLSISLDTEGCNLDYTAGTPKAMACEGFARF